MGNSHKSIVGEQYKSRIEYIEEYEPSEEKIESDIFNYDIILYKERATNELIACIEKDNQSDHLTQQEVDELDRRMAVNDNSSLLKLLGYYSSSEGDSMCGNSYNHFYLVEYPIATLKDEIDIRRHLNKPYIELDLWGFLRSMVNGLIEIQKLNKVCRNISSTTIYINSKGNYKISEQCLVKESSLLDEIFLKIFAKDMYLSPQQMSILREGDTLYDSSDPFLSDIFSLGVLMIELISLQDQSNMYRYNGKEIDVLVIELKQFLEFKGKTNFSKILVKIVMHMIEREEADRISILVLRDEVERNYFRVLQNTFEDIDIVRNDLQAKTVLIEYLLDRKNFEKDIKKARGPKQNEEDEELQIRRKTVTKAARRTTINNQNQAGQSNLKSIPSFELGNQEFVPSNANSNQSIRSKKSILKIGIQKIQKENKSHNGVAFNKATDIFSQILQLQREKQQLEELKLELEEIIVKDTQTNLDIDELTQKILENQQQQEELRLLHEAQKQQETSPIQEVEESGMYNSTRKGQQKLNLHSGNVNLNFYEDNIQQSVGTPGTHIHNAPYVHGKNYYASRGHPQGGLNTPNMRTILNSPIDITGSYTPSRYGGEGSNTPVYLRSQIGQEQFPIQKSGFSTITQSRYRHTGFTGEIQAMDMQEEYQLRKQREYEETLHDVRASLQQKSSRHDRGALAGSGKYQHVATLFQEDEKINQTDGSRSGKFQNKIHEAQSISSILQNSRQEVNRNPQKIQDNTPKQFSTRVENVNSPSYSNQLKNLHLHQNKQRIGSPMGILQDR